MDAQDFRNIAQGIQGCTVSLAVLSGGIWAAYRFWKLRSAVKAEEELLKMQLEKTKLEADITKLSSEIAVRVQMESRLEVEAFGTLPGNEVFLRVRRQITNTGNRPERVNLTECNAHVAPVNLSIERGLSIGAGVEGKYHNVVGTNVSATLYPDESMTLAYLIKIEEPTVYLVECFVVASAESRQIVLAATGDVEPSKENVAGRTVWSDTDYFDARV